MTIFLEVLIKLWNQKFVLGFNWELAYKLQKMCCILFYYRFSKLKTYSKITWNLFRLNILNSMLRKLQSLVMRSKRIILLTQRIYLNQWELGPNSFKCLWIFIAKEQYLREKVKRKFELDEVHKWIIVDIIHLDHSSISSKWRKYKPII